MAKNYTRENSAKDAFSLWENENADLVSSLNLKIKNIEQELRENLQPNQLYMIEKIMNRLENAVIDLHCKFEDWCFSDQL